MTNDFKAIVSAELDLSKIEQQLQQLNNEKIKLQVEVDQDSSKRLVESINRGMKNAKINIPDITKQLADSFNISDRSVVNKLKNQLNNMMNELSKTWNGSRFDKAREVEAELEDLKQSQKELAQQKLDNIINRYDGIISHIESRAEALNTDIEQAELKGYSDSGKYYSALKSNTEFEQQKLAAQIKAMEDSLAEDIASGIITAPSATSRGSEEWYEMTNQIYEAKQAYEDCTTELLEFNNKLREIEWSRADQKQEAVEGINSEKEFLRALLDEEDEQKYDENGNVTEYGKAAYGLHGLSYNVNMNQADTYAQRIAELDEDIAVEPFNEDLIAERERLLELQRESILAAEDEKAAMVDLVKEGIEAQLDSLKKLSDQYIKALKNQKNLYDYQNSVADQAEEVAKLQKRLAAYAGDDTDEGRLKRQELQAELEDAQKKLQETEYDKYISDQEEILDELYADYEEVLNKRLDNIDVLIQSVVNGINNNADEIKTTLETQAASVGTTLSDTMRSIWGDSGTVVTSYSDTSSTENTSVNSAIGDIKNTVGERQKAADTNADGAISQTQEDVPLVADNIEDTDSKLMAIIQKGTPRSKTLTKEEKKNKSKLWQHIVSTYGYTPYTGITKELGALLNISVSDKPTSAEKEKVRKAMVKKGYARGTNYVKENEWAWTQEDGEEIVTLPDGSILLPLSKGSGVINNPNTEKVLSLAENHDALMSLIHTGAAGKEKIYATDNITSPQKMVNNSTNLENMNITINLPNVTGYEDFVSKLQHDTKFEKIIQSMTIGRVNGKSSMNKYKYM